MWSLIPKSWRQVLIFTIEITRKQDLRMTPCLSSNKISKSSGQVKTKPIILQSPSISLSPARSRLAYLAESLLFANLVVCVCMFVCMSACGISGCVHVSVRLHVCMSICICTHVYKCRCQRLMPQVNLYLIF